MASLTTLIWVLVGLACWYIIVRVVRHFFRFPIPAFVARFINNPLRRRIQPPSTVVDWMDLREGMLALEIGPGPGTFTIEAAKRLGERGKLFAMDIEPKEILRLNKRIGREQVKNVETRVGSAYELPFPDGFFDRVFMVTVLGEIPDKRRALLEIKRVLKEDGLLAVGELLLDPDYPRSKTVIRWCEAQGFRLLGKHGRLLHYLLTFRK